MSKRAVQHERENVCVGLVTGVPGTMDRGRTNREQERRFRSNFYTVETILFPRSRPERSFPERGTLHRSRSTVTRCVGCGMREQACAVCAT